MKNLLNKGRVIVSCVSILAILAVSMLSMFTGMVFVTSADDSAADSETVSYPLNGKYDADVVIKEGGISYKDVATDGTVSEFTGFDSKFWLTAEGDGTAADPYIVETANQFAAVATGYLTYEDGKTYLDTTGVSFKVADGVKEFNMNNTDSKVDLSGDKTVAEVEAALADAKIRKEGDVTLNWSAKDKFKGRFDGNGVVVYGLKSNNGSYAGLFVQIAGATIRNITVKNCYFYGDSAGVLVGYNTTADPVTVQNCSVYNNVGVSTRLNSGVNYGGIIVGRCAQSSSKVTISNCLVYGNNLRHAKTVTKDPRVIGDYDINYSLVANFNTIGSLNVSDSIILGNVPYNVDYGHNSFHSSVFNNVYTDILDTEFTVVDFAKTSIDADTKIEHVIKTICNEDGTVLHTYNKYHDGVDQKINFSRTHEAGTLIKADASATGAAAKSVYSTLDENIWSFNESGYPTPRIYEVREYSAGKAWTGEVALLYAGGSGTQDSPYQIATAEELALMMTTMKAGEYFVLTADIVLNDTTAANWTDTAKKWFTSNDVCEFTGTFNGNGHTVSGIYYDGDQAGEYAGLIPVVGSGAVVKNVKIANSSLNGKSGAVGAAVGTVVDRCSTTTKFSAIVVEDTVKFEGRAVAGGIIGRIGYSAAKIDDCISKSAGLYGEVIGQANVKRSVSVGAYPFPSVDNVKVDAVYTDTAGLELEGVTVVANADMKGSAAETAMPGLNFTTSWTAVDGDYPAPTGAEASADGVVGEPWSGAVATGYAGGDGTKDKPYQIATGEQLAYFLVNMEPGTRGNLKYYKLTADIYLNDVEGNLWKDKIGCNEWYTQRSKGIKAASAKNAAWISLDGDGYVVYGLYINQTNNNDYYYRAGLIPYLHIGSEIKNLGISQAYLNGSLENTSESIGGLVGTISQDVARNNGIYDLTSDDINNLYSHDYEQARKVQNDSVYQEIEPDITNCFVDHTCVIRGYLAGGLVGSTGSSIRIQDCIVTATVEGTDEHGAIVGQDWSVISTMADTVSLPQNCVRPAMGGTYSDWRDRQAVWAAQVYQVYYFGIERMRNNYFIKLSNPKDRVGEAAKAIMTGLDWEETIGDGGTWRVVEGGTPVLTVFGKHRTAEELEKFSDKNFSPPEVTITFSTGTSDVQVEPISGRMYTKMQLPTNVQRDGYKFTGWYAFSDLSVEYPYDYFPPRSLTVFAGWEPMGVLQGFESYPETIWDFDDKYWIINKPGAQGGYKNAYVHSGGKSLHLLGTSTEAVDALLNYEDMLEPGKAYKLSFWVLADKDNTPATLLSLVHNSKPDYLNSAVAIEDMAVATGLKSGEWVQYSYSFTAQTKWVSLRATGNASLYFDDVMIIEMDGTLGSGNIINLGSNGATGGVLSPATGDSTVSIAILISAIMACAAVAVISRKNLVEVVED